LGNPLELSSNSPVRAAERRERPSSPAGIGGELRSLQDQIPPANSGRVQQLVGRQLLFSACRFLQLFA